MNQNQINLYDPNPPVQTVSEETKQNLIQKAKDFKKAFNAFEQTQFFSMPFYYILSLKWLQRWKIYVSYDEVNSDQNLNKFFGCGELPIINQNIVQKQFRSDIKFQDEQTHYNVRLQEGLSQKKDYIFLTEDMWNILKSDNYIQIKRFVEETSDGKKVQMYYQNFTVIPISNEYLKDIQKQKKHKVMSFNFQFSHYTTVSKFNDSIKQYIRKDMEYSYENRFSQILPAKLWLLPQNTQKSRLVNTFYQGCKANSSFSYKIFTDSTQIEDQAILSSIDLLEDSLLLLQLKEQRQDWCFFNKKHVLKSSCNSCRKVMELTYHCSCKFAVYCSRQCKDRDKSYHKFRCPNDAQSDEEEGQLLLTQQSRCGVVGLRNLGNTCFMNSGIQCCSHIPELSEYFVTNQYVGDINKDNPLGTSGELSQHYAKVIKQLWYGRESSIAPSQLKRAIGKFQPMFSGYNQHDSGELITYLLDGLHEDLNKIKKKPYVQTKSYDERPDAVIANESWQGFLLRNRSKIVDTMYGQYRSELVCPICKYISIQFDPFLMCSLPIINNSKKKIEVTLLRDHVVCDKITICFEKSSNWKMANILNEIKDKIQKPEARLISYVASYASCDIIDENRSANEVRSEYKYRTIFVRELEPQENPDEDLRLILGNTMCHSYYKDESYRKSLVPYRTYFFKKSATLKQIHHKLVAYYKKIKLFQNYEEDVINVQKKQQAIRMLSIPFSRYSPCEYCDKKNCDGCEIPYSDTTLEQYAKEVDQNKIQFQIYWRKDDKDVQKIFDECAEGKSSGQSDSGPKLKGQTSLQDCFNLFSQPQVLAQDNQWYCPKCKDHVCAQKQMHIYKAPKVFILCLKRFKRKDYFQQKYNILVDFPVEGLDLSGYIKNNKLPGQMQVDGEMQNQNVLYDLFGVSNHFGGTGGGHYTAYAKNPKTNKWYDFDDSYVKEVKDPQDVVSEGAYILFYRRRDA